MEYTVDYFLDKFQKIPEDNFGIGALYNNGKMCALGFCGVKSSDQDIITLNDFPEGTALNTLCRNFLGQFIWNINDGKGTIYKQPTPKQRILAALRDVKKKQESSQMLSSEPNVQASVATGDASSNWLDKTKNFTSLIPIPDEVSDLTKEKTNRYETNKRSTIYGLLYNASCGSTQK